MPRAKKKKAEVPAASRGLDARRLTSAAPPASVATLAQTIEDDGGWPASPNGQEPGRVYATSMALLTLTVPYRLLPAYQK